MIRLFGLFGWSIENITTVPQGDRVVVNSVIWSIIGNGALDDTIMLTLTLLSHAIEIIILWHHLADILFLTFCMPCNVFFNNAFFLNFFCRRHAQSPQPNFGNVMPRGWTMVLMRSKRKLSWMAFLANTPNKQNNICPKINFTKTM